MQTFLLATGLAVAALGAMTADWVTILIALSAICLACMLPDGI